MLDGALYKEVFDGSHFKGCTDRDDEIHVSVQFNTDGVAVFNSSTCSVWPAY